MQTDAGSEQVPQHELAVVQEEGQQKLQLSVKLPGLSSASDIQLVCSSSSIGLTVPGQYALLLPLNVTINDAADSVKFMKKKQTLTAKFTVISSATATPAAAKGSSSSSSSSSAGQQQQQAGDAAQRAAAAAAAEEAARREQQQRLNTEAAEEWMRRGVDAARAGNTALAEKALGKVGELAPHLNTAAMRSAIAAAKQQQGGQQQSSQQQQQQNGSQATGSGGNSSSQPPRQQQQQQQPQNNSNSNSNGRPSNAQQQSSAGAGAQQQGTTNSSSSGAAPSNQQQQQQKQHPKHKHKQKPASKPPPQQQRQQQQQGTSSSSSNINNGPAQQQQQQQQQHADEDDSGFSHSAWEQQQAAQATGGGLVGWWCRGYDRFEVWVMITGDLLNAWSKEPGRRWAVSTAAQLCAVLLVATHFCVMWLWRTGWTQPLHCAAYIRRTGGDTFIESQLWLGRTAISLAQHTLAAAAWRVGLCGVSAGATAAAAWGVGWMQLWGHSLVGWAWLLLCGIWRALVWRPWHSVQLPLAGVAVFVFGFAGVGGDIALWSLAMMLSPGGWLNLTAWGVAVAAKFGLLPFIPRTSWSSGLGGTVLLTAVFNSGCRWWGLKALKNPVDPLPRVSWWWWVLLLALYGFTALMQAAGKLREEEEHAKQGGSSSFGRDHADDEPFYGGASEIAYQKFVMGFGPVAVPEGCEVAEVKVALQARDYYQVMGLSSREACTPESLRAARKLKALAVHPDKVGHDHPGANQAAGRVNKAFETLSNEESRRAYDRLLDCHSRPRAPPGSSSRRGAAAAGGGGRPVSPEDASWLPPYSDSLYDIERSEAYMCDMDCPMGGHSHTVHILPQAPFGVRWCRECGSWHATREAGEVWAHWSPGLGGVRLLGRVRLLFAPGPDSPIFDITDLFKCGGKLINSQDKCNTHINHFEMLSGRAGRRSGGGGGGGGGDAGGSRRSRKKQGRRR